MIASPGDVIRERELAVDAIYQWNALNSRSTSIALLPARWETHSAPMMGDRPQGVIDTQVLDDSDLLVGIFWTRLGTPTGEARSGTVEEIERHLAAGKPAMLYFSDAPVVPSSIDPEQYERVQKFKEECESSGLLKVYEGPDEFRASFEKDLTIVVNTHEYFAARTADAQDLGSLAELVARLSDQGFSDALSDEAATLLVEASQDSSGSILRFRSMQGTSVQTNGKQFVERGDPRSEAAWEDAIVQLHERGLIRDRGAKGEVFSLTSSGYSVAEELAR